MQKKKRTGIFNISNKFAYTLIVVLSIVLMGMGVYAYNYPGPPSVMGHSADELDPPTNCIPGDVMMVVPGGWDCVDLPSSTDSRFTLNATGLVYSKVGNSCLLHEDIRCYFDSDWFYVDLGSTDCNTMSSGTRETICRGRCGWVNPICDGNDGPTASTCNGGTTVSYTTQASCGSSPDYILECRCLADGWYDQEEYIPAGTIKIIEYTDYNLYDGKLYNGYLGQEDCYWERCAPAKDWNSPMMCKPGYYAAGIITDQAGVCNWQLYCCRP